MKKDPSSSASQKTRKITFPQDLLAEAQAYCLEHNVSLSEFVRDAAAAALENLKSQRK